MNASGWDVRRIGGTVRVDLSRTDHLSAAESDEIVAATDEFLRDGEVSIVEVRAPVDGARPHRRLARLLKALHRLAERRDSQLIVGSI